MDIFLNQLIQFYSNNTTYLRHIPQRIILCYTHKMAIILWPYRDISVTVWPIFMKFGMLMQNVSLNHSEHSKIRISRIQDGGRPPFWKPLNLHISAAVWPILMKFGAMTHIGPLQRIDR